MSHHHTDTPEDHDLGLGHDLPTLLNRRRALGLLSGAGLAAALAACGGTDSPADSPSSSTSTSSKATNSSGTVTEEVPEETGGPFPADGTNGVNVLTESGIVRSDISTSFGSSSTAAQGVPMNIEMTVFDLSGTGVKPYAGAAVYAWHCDQEGRYSMYDSEIAEENYLRGVQATDASGKVVFKSIFPAAYDGRWPHIHFEVYPSLAKATSASGKLRTSQIALPEDICKKVYATSGYEQSVSNLARTSLDSDMVFSDGYSLQLGTATGSVTDGLTIALNVAV